MNREPLSADPRQVDAALRTQLNDAAAASQLLLRRCESEKDLEYLEIIYRAVLRAARVLDNRALARKLEDEDELRAVFLPMDLVSWCRELTDRVAALLGTMGISLSFRTELKELVTLGDQTLLEQMMYELLSNAAKAARPGGRVAVALSGGEKMAAIIISDEGDGISKEALDRLLRDEEGPHAPDLTPEAGAGLGLRLTRAIVGIHGGLTMIETAPGGGTRMAVSLPLREGTRDRLESPRLSGEGYDRALTALSDVLPLEAFRGAAKNV